jgi:hypothetical protein
MAYRQAFPYSLRCMHDVFHVSILRNCISDSSHVISMIYLEVLDEGSIMAEPIYILDHLTQQLRCRIVDQFKVQWDDYSPHLATWEDAYEMHE